MVMIAMSVIIFEVAVSTVIPVVVVFNSATATLPKPSVIPFAVMARRDPMSAFVRRSSPIAFMPFVMSSHRIPIALHPHGSRIWHSGDNHSYLGRGRRPNHDSNGDLRFTQANRDKQNCD